ncbi:MULTISPECIES: DUF3299 domain-containing protein [unclassified Ruegeria]|uniref:DUF3299 domain-containing protein n=1 Tax=unclassified Ruegeria TaxID=2625375 RepID=UPI00148820CB|nr:MULTISPECIES: DUF3299 domain-containing protein [unclassified Ruegeria]NOD89419.1 DUF3299 domain-containing protein [Ruegeria sp. HKCCD4318]NOE13418.1 DUF3299 domain-containing protein [Ruegeria sp. HKCCD4318-2]NOG07833.1 DUF3299 domain-containing protein [Ruegeria sp. HKCCD4315]
MRNWLRSIIVAGLVWCAPPALAANGVAVDWADLPDPSAQVFEDPYRDLSPEQFDDVLFVVRLRGRMEQGNGSEEERQKWQELLAETEDALAAEDIDIDWLLDQREVVTERRRKAATDGNPQHNGQTVTLAGFAIPAPSDPDGRPVAYLVPERGMCSHMPPPPPNQMIRVRLNDDWAPSYYHEPVRLTGRLTIDPSVQSMMVVDGLMPMSATFQLETDSVETLETEADRLEWKQRAADRIRAAGDRKTGGARASE